MYVCFTKLTNFKDNNLEKKNSSCLEIFQKKNQNIYNIIQCVENVNIRI